MRGSKKSVFSGPKTLNVGGGRGHNQDLLQPALQQGHQQPGPGTGIQTYSVGGQDTSPDTGMAATDPTDHAKKLGVGYGKPKVSPGFPAGVRK